MKRKGLPTTQDFRNDYDKLKNDIITAIWMMIRTQPDDRLEIMEERDIPAIIIQTIDDQISEVIDELVIDGSKVKAWTSMYDEYAEYDIESFDIPMLIAIYDSVDKHLELLESEA